MNITGLNTSYVPQSYGAETVYMSDMVKEYCVALSDKIVLVGALLLLYFILVTIVLPQSKQALKDLCYNSKYEWFWDDYLKGFYSLLVSILETFGIGATLFILGYSYFFGWAWYIWVIVLTCTAFVGLLLIAKLIGFVRGKLAKN